MIAADTFIGEGLERGFQLYTGVPCSYLKALINRVIDSDEVRWVPAANEGDAVAIAAGAELGGVRSAVLLQNSGLGNAVNPLTSLTRIFEIPVLIIVTLRGEPGGPPDEPQHAFMGAITTATLDLLEIPWEWLPDDDRAVGPAFERAAAHMEVRRTPFAFVVKKGTIAPAPLRREPEPRPLSRASSTAELSMAEARPSRREILRRVAENSRPDDVIVATTGYTGRELYALEDRPNQIYMVGSMGCASSLGLGLAIAQADRRVIVLEGDGALLMRLGALATVGYQRPKNFLHIALDNEVHESTGGQSTVSHSIDFAAIARACGYPVVASTADPEEVARRARSSAEGPEFLHVKIAPGTPDSLPRPTITPAQVARRLRAHLGTGGS